MSIDAIGGALTSPLYAPGLRPGGADEARVPAQPTTVAAPQHAASPRRASDAVPAQAPEGTDPALWSVLTSEERAFFARARAMGPVTYGPGHSSALSGAPLGGRLDMRA